jgi:hypothetical protein
MVQGQTVSASDPPRRVIGAPQLALAIPVE